MGIFSRLKNAVPGLKGADRFPAEVYIQWSQENVSKRKVTSTAPCEQTPGQQNAEYLSRTESPQDTTRFDSDQERFKAGLRIGGHRSTADSNANKYANESIIETVKPGSSDGTTVETLKGSCVSLEDILGGILMCGRCDKYEKKVPELEAPPTQSVPREISFTKYRPPTWEESHVLLTEVDNYDDSDENLSMTGSLLQRLRGRPKGKRVMSPRMRVYVEQPRTRKELASVDNSALTEPGGRATTLEKSTGVAGLSRR